MPSIKFKYWTDSNIQLENFLLLIIVKWFLLSFLLRNITHFLIILKPSLNPMDLLEDGITCIGNETGVLGPYIDRYISFSDTSPLSNPSQLIFCNISILLKSFSTRKPSQYVTFSNRNVGKYSTFSAPSYSKVPNNRVGGTKTLKVNKRVGVFMYC